MFAKKIAMFISYPFKVYIILINDVTEQLYGECEPSGMYDSIVSKASCSDPAS